MGIRDESAVAGTASDAWDSRDPQGLRAADDDGLRGRFSPAFLVAQATPAPADTAPDEDRAALQAIRDDIAGLRAEVGWLSEFVASDRREEGEQAQQAAAPALLPPVAELRTDAINRVDAAATHLVRTASTTPDARREWKRTDEAVAGLLQAFARQAEAEPEPSRPGKADASRLRIERQRARLENERTALRKFRSRRWWTRSALG